MTLTLIIRNFDRLDNGMPTEFVLHQRGALIGRSPTCDWCLPDPRNYISSRHCEVTFGDGFYTLTDISMNGTTLNGGGDRMAQPRRIQHGDVFSIGQYEVHAALTGAASAAVEREAEQQAQAAANVGNWGGWESHGGGAAPAPPPEYSPVDPVAGGGSDSGWGSVPTAPSSGGASWQPQVGPSLGRQEPYQSPAAAAPPPSVSGGWAPSMQATPPVVSAWDQPEAKADPASAWSSAAPDRPPAASPDDIWGRIAEGNVVDWARGGFGQPAEEKRDPLGLNKAAPQESLNKAPPRMAQFGANDSWGAPAAPPPPAAAPSAPSAPHPAAPPPAFAAPAPAAAAANPDAVLQAFVQSLGLAPGQVQADAATVDRAGQLFRTLVAGLVVMIEARARAKSQMGAESTAFSVDGNNPIKFARTPEEAIVALLNPPQRGFMEAGRAIEDAYFDLQSHQMATLKAMQGALRATLDRFSPTAIRKRAEAGGLLSRILPGAKDAALWQAYEKEFSGVAHGSDEAFMDVFAKEFRKAYDEQARSQKRR